MHLLIIGATRGIGLQLLKQALAAGHAVTVPARRPRKITERHDNLRVLQGDILDEDSVDLAVAGQEAVCLTIGVKVTLKPVSVFSAGTANVLAAMQRHRVRRLVCVTGIGAGDSRGHGGFLYDRIFQPLLLKTIYADKDRQEALIRAGDTAWTIVRPARLTNGPLTGKYRVLTDLRGITAGRISRADVAHFILTELAANRYLNQTPLLTY
ncbi:MAG: SDR family oxidoreductase [Deltaproteobacteria bacterium]|nr:SDR family oxidoreductase [Deltaproteobacteria bacterium]